MNNEKASVTERKANYVNDNLDLVKGEIREAFPPENYELLVDFAARVFCEGAFMREEIKQFERVMKNMEWAKGGGADKDTLELLKETYKNNHLFKKVIHLDSLSGTFASWHRNKALHAHDKEAKKNVLEWWKADKAAGYKKKARIGEYQNKLKKLGLLPKVNTKSKNEQRQPDEENNYTYETIFHWLTNK